MESSVTKQSKEQEKRGHIRVEFTTRIIINAGNAEIETEGTSRDLSLNGVFINTDKNLPVGTQCSVRIFLSGGVDDIELKMNAYVARYGNHGLGLTFSSMDLDSYTYLRNIMRYNTENFNEI